MRSLSDEPRGVQVRSAGGSIATLHTASVLQHRYQLLHADGSTPVPDEEFPAIRPLGQGGFGVVIRGQDSGLDIRWALKFFEINSMPGGVEAHRQEIELANAEPFKHVIRVIDYQIERDIEDRHYGFYVMDFIDGTSLDRFLSTYIHPYHDEILADPRKQTVLYRMVFSLLDQLVSAVSELHAAEIAHLDLKPQNVLIKCGFLCEPDFHFPDHPEFSLFLGDLGAAKKLSATFDDPRTWLIKTDNYFPLINNTKYGFRRDDHKYDRSSINRFGFEIDLFALGRTLEEIFFDRHNTFLPKPHQPWSRLPTQTKESRKQTLWEAVLGDEFEVIKLITASLQSGETASAKKLAASLNKVSRLQPADLRSSTILTDIYPGTQLRVTPELITFAEPVKSIIHHPAFIRLKKQRQLSLVSEIFPGATHTRYSHSLLTFFLAKRFLLSLGRNSHFRYLFQQRDIDAILFAALLHDIGQYPFAHSIEDLRKAGDRIDGLEHLASVRWDHELLEDMTTLKDDKGFSIGDYLAKAGVSVNDVNTLVRKDDKRSTDDERSAPLTQKILLAREIINSTIDVDRLSYLLLDSYMTGVPYGQGVDIDTLMESLTLKVDMYETALGVTENGVSAAEMVVAAVYLMYKNVYWHPTNRRFMACIKFCIDALLREERLDFQQYVRRTLDLDDYAALDFIETMYKECSIAAHGNPLEQLCNTDKPPYVLGAEIGYSEGRPGEVWDAIVLGLTARRLQELTEIVGELLGRPKVDLDPLVLWDIPLKPRLHSRGAGRQLNPEETQGERLTGLRLWVRLERPRIGEASRWQKLEDYSHIARAAATEEKRQGRKVRLFVHHSALDSSKYSGNLRSFEEAVLLAVDDLVEEWSTSSRTPTTMGPRIGPKRSSRIPGGSDRESGEKLA